MGWFLFTITVRDTGEERRKENHSIFHLKKKVHPLHFLASSLFFPFFFYHNFLSNFQNTKKKFLNLFTQFQICSFPKKLSHFWNLKKSFLKKKKKKQNLIFSRLSISLNTKNRHTHIHFFFKHSKNDFLIFTKYWNFFFFPFLHSHYFLFIFTNSSWKIHNLFFLKFLFFIFLFLFTNFFFEYSQFSFSFHSQFFFFTLWIIFSSLFLPTISRLWWLNLVIFVFCFFFLEKRNLW